ncbi:chaperonin 10-like protein [Mycena crocata]|nr:chaperonin 10-like protein [Mycena crocata]
MSAQQQAIIIESPKAPFILAPRDIPKPAKGDVLIRVMSISLNPVNWKQREIGFLIDEYPAVIGQDIAGVVEELGEGVHGLKKGDKVFAQALKGGFQQYTTIPAAVLIPIPDNVSFDEVATFPIAFTTACVGLFAPSPIGLGLNPTFSWDKPQQGESALVIGAGTTVGQFAIQLLKFLGFTRIVAYASKAHFDYLKQLGATECIDRGEVSVESLARNPPVKVVYDCAGALGAVDCVVEGGLIVTVAGRLPWDESKKLTLARVQGYYAGPDVMKWSRDDVIGYAATPQHSAFGKLLVKNLPELLTKGVVTAPRYEVLPNGLSGILAGMERLQKGSVSGVKLVAHPQE